MDRNTERRSIPIIGSDEFGLSEKDVEIAVSELTNSLVSCREGLTDPNEKIQ